MDQTDIKENVDRDEADKIIVRELAELLQSPLFIRSPVLSRLLQFLADHRLQGARVAPKAYAIATEALGRDADFDPAVDSYPRVMIGRLRSLLDRYYGERPWAYRLRVPQGSYELVVQHRAAPPAPVREYDPGDDPNALIGEDAAAGLMQPPSDLQRGWHWVGPALFILGLLLLVGWRVVSERDGLLAPDPRSYPVVEISAPSGSETATGRALARAVDGRLRDGLRRFDMVDLLSARSSEGSARPSADYRIDVSLAGADEEPVDVTIMLNRLSDQRTIWSQQLRLSDEDEPEYAALDPVIAQIGSDYGVIVRDQVQRRPSDFAPGYPCLAQFQRLRHMQALEDAERVGRCLQATVSARPLDPVALASLSWLRFDQWQRAKGSEEGQEYYAEARNLADRAYRNGINKPAGLFAMARAHFYEGNCSSSQAMGDAALALNRYDSNISGFLGVYRATCGDEEEGEALLRRALALDAAPTGLPAVSLAFLTSERGQQQETLAILDAMPSPSNVEPQQRIVRAIAVAREGRLPEGRKLWAQVRADSGLPAEASTERVLGRFIFSSRMLQRTRAALRDSGVAP
ncbi:hypothetical protein [Sphingopyxis sp. MWB1]|uniref:hypothetical protein n=1 Tax=Sphingopyxis sp. MWB1 TaxID=1537715 RepID=UPI000519F5EB|nr:hypothetical protein [Sphingopyxis sp. MWB1]